MSHTIIPTDATDTLVKGDMLEVRSTGTTDIRAEIGTFVSITSKGINFKAADNGKTITRSLNKVVAIIRITPDADAPVDMFSDDRTYTTAELAAMLDMEAKALRVQLRKLGLGVGKGTRYGLDAVAARHIFMVLENNR